MKVKSLSFAFALAACMVQAAFEPAKITPQTGPRENLERTFFYSLHETDKEKSLPRVLLVGDRVALSTYPAVQQALRGRAVVTVWDSSYDMNRPEFDALLDVYLRTHDYAAVYLSNGCETSLKPPAFAKELARVVREIRAVQPKSTKLVLATVPPKYAPKDKTVVPYNDAIRQVAAEEKADAVSDLFTPGTALSPADFYSNGLCGKAVYDRLAEVVAEDLSRFLPEKGMAVAVEPKKDVPTCTDYAFPIHPAIGGRENIEWSTFYAFHETDECKDLPRVLMVGDSITQSFYEEAARQLRGKANVSVWVNSYNSLRPEYQAKLKVFLRTQKYAVVHYNSNLHCYPTDEDWEAGLRLSLKTIREEQPQAKVVWVNNPLPRDRKPNMKKRYHDIGCRVTAEFGVDGVNDIHKMTENFTPDMYHDEVHFEKAAQKMAADQAVAAILPLLPKKNQPVPAGAEELPLYQLRFSSTVTSPDVWPEVRAAFDRHPGVFDEVWFSTGVTYPAMAWHERKADEQAAAAAELRARGITPSLQVQVTLGHGFVTTNRAEWAAKTWRDFTGVGGEGCPGGSCPRDSRFLEYISASTACYAKYRPAWVWIDDDLRVLGHGPAAPWLYSGDPRTFGCWCEGCLKDFSAREGRTWTRETLAAAMEKDAALGDRWETFAFESVAEVARRIVGRFHALSPETRYGYQHAAHFNGKQRIVFKAIYEACGRRGVGDRPGGSWYQDHDPYGTILKAYREARESAMLGDMPEIVLTTPEIETYPRVFSSRTGRGLLLESLAALTMGMNALSLYFFDPGRSGEDVAFYERRFFTQLAANVASLRAFRRHTEGTLPAGLRPNRDYPVFAPRTMEAGTPDDMELTTGVPIAFGKAHYCGTLDMDGVNARAISSLKLTELYARADKAAGGRLPVLPAEPLQGWLMPRTLPDGTLKSVTFVNTTLDASWPTRLRLRGVKPGTQAAVWRALDGTVERCAVSFEGDDAFVTLPAVSAWNGGWLAL